MSSFSVPEPGLRSAGARPMSCRKDYLLLALLGVAVLIPGLWRGLTVDEYITWARGSWFPLPDLIRDRLQHGHFPTYFILMKGWMAAFGSSEVVMRIPGALMTVAALLLFRMLMGSLSDRRTANLGAVIFALHQVVIWCGQTARPYAGMLLCSVAAALGIVRWWKEGRPGWLVLVAVATGVGFLFQAAFALTALAFVVAALTRVRRAPRRPLILTAALVAPLLILSLPAVSLARSQEKFRTAEPRKSKVRLGGISSSLGNVAFGTVDVWAGNGWRYPGFLLFVGLLVAARSGAKRGAAGTALLPEGGGPEGGAEPGRERQAAEEALPPLLAAWFLVPFAGLVAWQAGSGSSILSHERYFVPALGGMIALVALGVRRAQAIPWAGRVPLFAVLGALTANSAAFWISEGDGPKQVLRAMDAPGSGIPVATDSVQSLCYEYREHEPEALDLKPLSLEEAREELARFGRGRRVWLYIYNNSQDELDPLLESPPAGMVVERRHSFRSARAALLAPASPGSEGEQHAGGDGVLASGEAVSPGE